MNRDDDGPPRDSAEIAGSSIALLLKAIGVVIAKCSAQLGFGAAAAGGTLVLLGSTPAAVPLLVIGSAATAATIGKWVDGYARLRGAAQSYKIEDRRLSANHQLLLETERAKRQRELEWEEDRERERLRDIRGQELRAREEEIRERVKREELLREQEIREKVIREIRELANAKRTTNS